MWVTHMHAYTGPTDYDGSDGDKGEEKHGNRCVTRNNVMAADCNQLSSPQ